MWVCELCCLQYYDIRKTCEGSLCYDFSNMETFLNQKTVRDALGVGDIEFVSCSSVVYDAMTRDWMRNLAVGVPALLEDGIKVLIYAGEEDLICNWLGKSPWYNKLINPVFDQWQHYHACCLPGNSRWVNGLAWSGQKDFGAAPTVPFVVEGREAGQLKSHGPLSFLKVISPVVFLCCFCVCCDDI